MTDVLQSLLASETQRVAAPRWLQTCKNVTEAHLLSPHTIAKRPDSRVLGWVSLQAHYLGPEARRFYLMASAIWQKVKRH